jgi:hypothetical protein
MTFQWEVWRPMCSFGGSGDKGTSEKGPPYICHSHKCSQIEVQEGIFGVSFSWTPNSLFQALSHTHTHTWTFCCKDLQYNVLCLSNSSWSSSLWHDHKERANGTLFLFPKTLVLAKSSLLGFLRSVLLIRIFTSKLAVIIITPRFTWKRT